MADRNCPGATAPERPPETRDGAPRDLLHDAPPPDAWPGYTLTKERRPQPPTWGGTAMDEPNDSGFFSCRLVAAEGATPADLVNDASLMVDSALEVMLDKFEELPGAVWASFYLTKQAASLLTAAHAMLTAPPSPKRPGDGPPLAAVD